MNKRIRKKKRRGEFTQYGFELALWMEIGADPDAIVDGLIALAEERGLCLAGGLDETVGAFFLYRHKASAVDDDRWWMAQCSSIAGINKIRIGRLEDAWH